MEEPSPPPRGGLKAEGKTKESPKSNCQRKVPINVEHFIWLNLEKENYEAEIVDLPHLNLYTESYLRNE